MSTDEIKKQRCRRCRRTFTIRKEGQQYGPKCEQKVAGQIDLDGRDVIPGQEVRV